MTVFAIVLVVAAALAVAAIFLTPTHVRYDEVIEIAATPAEIYDHIRYQERLMQWSAWPSTTNSDCRVSGTDGAVGAQTLFLDKQGKVFGHQEVTELERDRRVVFKLESKGPPHWPVLEFLLDPIAGGGTRVTLRFDNKIARPFHLILRIAGITRWTRMMHRKDLAGLKAYAEPPHRSYDGAIVGPLASAA